MARELGDRTTEDRIRARAEAAYEPQRFRENDDCFGYVPATLGGSCCGS